MPPSHIEAPSDREIVSTRLFSAPREKVFRAFADPAQVARWWGPHGFTSTIQEFDLRVGGRWQLIMHGPDGAAFHNESEFTVVEQPVRIVYQHLEPMHRFQMTMLFADRGEKTELTWRMRFESLSEVEKLRRFIADANEQNFDRLAAHLAHSA
jgi:uncharacterized protein YndB with AHSA1/START domain